MFIVSLILLTASLKAREIETPFDVNEIIAQVNRPRYSVGSRDGEFVIDTNLVTVPAVASQTTPAIAFDGINYFVVWQDQRKEHGWSDIYGTRVSQAGVVLDPTGIVISAATESQDNPSVAFDGTNYFVVWSDGRRGSAYSDIYGARVTQAGVVLDTSGIAISVVSPNTQHRPAIAFDGVNYLAVWERYYSDQSEIFAARVAPSGEVLDTVAINITNAVDYQRRPEVTSNGTNYFVVWTDQRNDPGGYDYDIYGTRVTPTGVVLDSTGIAISTAANAQATPSIAFDGLYFFVVWHDWRYDPGNWSNCDIYGTFVDQSGMVMDSLGIAISTALNLQYRPSITSDGTNYLITWMDTRNNQYEYDIYGTRVSQAGVVIDTAGIPISTAEDDQWDQVVAFDGTNYLVVWYDCRSASHSTSIDIYGARVDQSGIVLDSTGIVISTAPNEQTSSSVAFDGTNYFVVWQDFHTDSSYWDIYGLRVSESGTVLDTASIRISNAANNQWWPSVVFGNGNYLVVWQDYRSGSSWPEIFGARVSQSGVVLDSSGFFISTYTDIGSSPSVAFDGTNHLVVWADLRNGWCDIYGARVDQTGVVLDTTGIAISTADDRQANPTCIFDGTNYLVVWDDIRNSSSSYDIYAARVNPAGTVLDSLGNAISNALERQSCPSVAFDGVNYLVIWHDDRSSNYYDIYGARVNQSGIAFDWLCITSDVSDQIFPAVTFDGTDYIVVWQEHSLELHAYDVYGAKVSTGGVLIDTFTVSTQSGDQISPALGHGTGNKVLITYSGWADSIGNYPVNIKRIWGKFYPLVGIEENVGTSEQKKELNLRVYPNPIQNECHIKYSLLQKTEVNLSLYDVTGRLVKTITDAKQDPCNYTKIFNVNNLSQGIYFIRLQTEDQSETQKLIFIK